MKTTEDQPALLFLDILGTKSVWSESGVEGATALFSQFQELILEAVRENQDEILSGAIESDSAAFVCIDAASAVSLGSSIFRAAFFNPSPAATKEHRIWLRGVVGPAGDTFNVSEMRVSTPLSDDAPRVTVETYADELLDAISAEKSGFKGMRLLIDGAIISPRTRTKHRFALPDSNYNFAPFTHLGHSIYPSRLGKHQDVLWMATGDEDEWLKRRSQMSARIRYSGRNPEEFLQAAATQVVFDECDAIMTTLRRRPKQAPRRRATSKS